MAQVSAQPTDPPGPVGLAGRAQAGGSLDGDGPSGPVERLMSGLIRKLAWSRLSQPRVAVAVSAFGLLLGLVVGATGLAPAE